MQALLGAKQPLGEGAGRSLQEGRELAELRVPGVLQTEGRKSYGDRDKDERWETTSGTPLTPMICARCILGSPSGLPSQEQV